MRLNLWLRLFLVHAGLIVLALGVLVWAQQRSFRHGLLDYLNGLDRERAVELARRLELLHARAGSFEPLRVRQGLLRNLVINLSDPDADPFARPPRFGEGRGDRRPPRFDAPPGADRNDTQRPAREHFGPGPPPEPPPPPDAPPPPPPLPPPARTGPMDFLARLAVVDDQGVLLAGNSRVVTEVKALRVAIGQGLGAVLLAPLPQLANEAELRFANDQLQAALWTVLAVLLLASVAALLLARRLLLPLQAVSAAARKLAAGDHSARAAVTRRDELGALALDFNRLAETLDRNRQARQRWIADISHELRTPLAVLIGEMQALEDGLRSFSPAALASLQTEAARIRQLVDDLYQLALADSGALEYRFETIDAVPLLTEVVELHRAGFASAGLRLDTELPESPARLRADPGRLRQLLGNLLGNSLRYTDAGGQVRLGLVAEGAQWRISLEDSAPGVPDSALPRLFDRLYRVEGSRSRDAGGAGLGLAIAREIVLAHGGDLRAIHSSLGGLRLEIRLPRA